ncbi:DAK2 domain-containing protein, partial [Streptomyces prunicolor]|uniref:DAK2 domain-containing protein n=1 Tax=Streptomyces prunicolor TaxID=67348 RepID=UPI0033E15718
MKRARGSPRVGGASGPLYGTLLRRTGKALGDAAEVSEEEFAVALRTGVDAVMTLGGAAPGDKTMAPTPGGVGAPVFKS